MRIDIYIDGWLLGFYVRTTSNIISRRILIGDSAYSRGIYSTLTPGDHEGGTRISFSTLSHYSDTLLASPDIVMPRVRLGSAKYQYYRVIAFELPGFSRIP